MTARKFEFRMPSRISPEREARRAKMRVLMENADTVRFNMAMPRGVHTKFKRQCVNGHQKMNQVLMDMVLKYIESNGESIDS